MDDFLWLQARVPKSDGGKAALRQDKPIGADSPVNAGMELIRTTRVVRIDEH